mgnify:CR=1 FL=1
MTNKTAYLYQDLLTGKAYSIEVKDGLIVARKKVADDSQNLPTLVPSLVDLQVNGYKGYDLNEDHLEPELVEAISDSLCSVGVRNYLPTLITAGESDLCQRLQSIKQAKEKLPKSKLMIAGIHMEGPAISPNDGYRGAHPREFIRPASMAEFSRWQKASGNLIKMITIAPETDGALGFIKDVTARKIIVALGHCDTDEFNITDAVSAGARMSTHLGNGIDINLRRHPNPIWTQLAEDRLTASFIADGHHLSKSVLKSMLRAKGIEHSILVSDSVKFAGMKPGRYSSHIGREVDVWANRRVSVADTPYLAGSGSSLLDIVISFSQFTNMPLKHAVLMASINPGKMIGLKNPMRMGAPANFICFDHSKISFKTSVREIIFHGKSVL